MAPAVPERFQEFVRVLGGLLWKGLDGVQAHGRQLQGPSDSQRDVAA